MSNAIILQNISKKYTLSQDRPILLKNLFVPQKKEEVWALKNVTLTIKKGETIGIIGENGSGKSTLLKIIAGITTPTKGIVRVNGRVGSLIELGAGFHQDLTGKENIYLNGTLLGFTKKELDKKYDEIVEFADIGEYINQPIRTYSSGMTVRLGFSVAVHLDPDILLIDEVLAVGDEEFQRKCMKKINYLKGKMTIIVVSHNLALLEYNCKKILFLREGKLQLLGDPKTAIKKYLKSLEISSQNKRPHESIKGTKEIEITSIGIYKNNIRQKKVLSNETVKFLIKVKANKDVNSPILNLKITNENGILVYDLNNLWQVFNWGNFRKNKKYMMEVSIALHLIPSKYYVTGILAYKDGLGFYDWKENELFFYIQGDNHLKGIMYAEPQFDSKEIN